MANQTLKPQQKRFVNETVRPAFERLIEMKLYFDALLMEMENQQSPIVISEDILADDIKTDQPRSDAPQLTGQNVENLRQIVSYLLSQINSEQISDAVKLSVRSVPQIIKS